ncbi:hypothetical protein CCMA1212_000557 [Trichoderma ghanense]|uniref:Uncharacterized protein n=1 Tax=Trichoderma ghanense TaxID=65468 RepID=A0ABY2HE15_9HYPO
MADQTEDAELNPTPYAALIRAVVSITNPDVCPTRLSHEQGLDLGAVAKWHGAETKHLAMMAMFIPQNHVNCRSSALNTRYIRVEMPPTTITSIRPEPLNSAPLQNANKSSLPNLAQPTGSPALNNHLLERPPPLPLSWRSPGSYRKIGQ